MILNGYAVLAIFVGLVELVLGAWVVALGLSSLRQRRDGDVVLVASDARVSLLLLLSLALLGASVASWPLLYLLLASYIPEWAGVMCIQGVARVGLGSEGAAGWLPVLVGLVQATKAALVFATGAWLVLHLLNRATDTGPLARRIVVLMVAAGAIALVDASAQLAYVGIPKQERFLATGCCTLPPTLGGRGPATLPFLAAMGPATARHVLAGAFYVTTGTAILVAWTGWRSPPQPRLHARSRAVATGAVAVVGFLVAIPFLREIASPVFLGRPEHRCAYCVVTAGPIGLAAIASYLVGGLATGWAGVVDGLGRTDESAATASRERRVLLRAGAIGYLGSLVLVTGRMLSG